MNVEEDVHGLTIPLLNRGRMMLELLVEGFEHCFLFLLDDTAVQGLNDTCPFAGRPIFELTLIADLVHGIFSFIFSMIVGARSITPTSC